MDSRCAFISTEDVLEGRVGPQQTRQLDKQFGNTDLIRALTALHVAGPYTVVNPWEIEDEHGIRRINATGYAALLFGEMHPDQVGFLHEYLNRNRSMGLPQNSASAWRAALQHNLIHLLASVAPSHADSAVILSNSGAEAVEAAIKFVRGTRRGARYLINFENAYHGLTWMALSLTPSEEYQGPFKPLAPDVVTLPFGDFRAFQQTVEKLGPKNVGGVIVEPIQGEAGVIIPPSGYLAELGSFCRRHRILVVADEIQTGMGRSGHWFASIAHGLEPDVLTLGKTLGGGMVPIGVTIARRDLFEKTLGGMGCGRNSSTFGGNSLAAAVALRSLELLMEGNIPLRAAEFGERGLARLKVIQARYPDLIEAVRGYGMLFALQFRPLASSHIPGADAEMVHTLVALLGLQALHEAGVEANVPVTSKRTVRLTPALNMPEPIFDQMWERVERAAAANPRCWRLLLHTHLRTLVGFAELARAS